MSLYYIIDSQMNSKYQSVLVNTHKKSQGYKSKLFELSYTENKYRCYLKQFWTEYAKEYIDQFEKDNSNQIREQYCKQKSINVSSIIKNEELDQSDNMSLGRILYDVNQQKKVNYELTQEKFDSSLLKQKNVSSMKKKIQSQTIEVRRDKDSKFEVTSSQKKQPPKKEQPKVEKSEPSELNTNKKTQTVNHKINGENKATENSSIKQSSETKVKIQQPSNGVDAKQIEAQPSRKQPNNFIKTNQQANPLKNPIQSDQLPKADQQQEQVEVVEEQTVSIYHMLNLENSKLKNVEQIKAQNSNETYSDLSQTRNTSNKPQQVEIQEEYQNQSSVTQLPINQMSQDPNHLSLGDNSGNEKQRQIEDNTTRNQATKIDQEQVDQNHFVTCIAENTLHIQNQPQFESKMSGIQDYQSYSNVAILQEEIADKKQSDQNNKQLDQQVDKIIQSFLDEVEKKSLLLNEKIIKINETVHSLKEENKKLQDEKKELVQKNQQLNQNLVQANKKNAQLMENLQKEKKQNFDHKIKIQQLQALIKELQQKDIFNNTQLVNLSQGIKRNRSQQALLQKNDSSCNSKQAKQNNRANDSDQESEKNSSECQVKQNKVNQNKSEDQSQKSPSDLEQQSKQNTKIILPTVPQSKIQQRQISQRRSSES